MNVTAIERLTAERDAAHAALAAEKVGNAFRNSTFARNRLNVPLDMVEARFGSSFRVEDGQLVGYDAAGHQMLSRVRLGEVADFDEALETLVNAYPYRDSILKGSGASGGGAGGSHGAQGGRKTFTRAQFEAMDPGEQMAAMKAGGTVV